MASDRTNTNDTIDTAIFPPKKYVTYLSRCFRHLIQRDIRALQKSL